MVDDNDVYIMHVKRYVIKTVVWVKKVMWHMMMCTCLISRELH
jgi:hypothetical protein